VVLTRVPAVQVQLGDRKGVVQSYDAGSGEFCVVHGDVNELGVIDTSADAPRQLAPLTAMQLVLPNVGDSAKMIQAAQGCAAGSVGTVIGDDNTEQIVKLMPRNDIQILPKSVIGKLNQASAAAG
jgi:hypothetical protein